MAEHIHGSVDPKPHQKTFDTFIRFSAWGAGLSLGFLVFLALANG